VGAFRAVFPKQTTVLSGLDFIADLCDLDRRINEADLVITGEGSYDLQTL
jgi:glycerate kinase